ncbi:MAG TPA: hypothetical protein VND45_14960, partial [Thermoanaerobaculia bacterium]|nr:hypothetical protein [Thermoanaerobaculia bacterium]
MLLCTLVVSCLAAAAPSKKVATKPKPKPKGAAGWLASTLGIDPKAFANMTAVRGDAAAGAGRRLIELDLATGVETTLWECGRCWSPALAPNGVVVLREDGGTTAMWVLPADGAAARAIVPLPSATSILGATDMPERVAVTVRDARCGESEHGVTLVDVAAATVTVQKDAPCLVPPFPARDRLRKNRIVATTAERDASGKRIPRRLVVKEPADAPAPTAKRLAPFSDTVDRFDPIWRSDTRVIYVADGAAPRPQAVRPFVLHAWVPELGPPQEPLSELERGLLRVAALVRDGKFKSAERELARLEPLAVSTREQFLLLLFRHRTRVRRHF